MNDTLIAWADEQIKRIQTGVGPGAGPERNSFPEDMKGNVAKRLWNDSTFTYGMEYGYLQAMLDLKAKLSEA